MEEPSPTITWPEATLVQIATNLDLGLSSFLHRTDGNILTLPAPSQLDFSEEGEWKETIRELRAATEKYLQVDAPASMVQYRWMEEFAGKLGNGRVSNMLFDALSRKRPFANFREELGQHQLFDQWNPFIMGKYLVSTREQLAAGGRVSHPWVVDAIDIFADDDDEEESDED